MENNIASLDTFDLKAIKDGIKQYQAKLDELRADGLTKIKLYKDELTLVRGDKLLSKEERKVKVDELKVLIAEANKSAKETKTKDKEIVSEAKNYIKNEFVPYYKSFSSEAKKRKAEAKKVYLEKVQVAKDEFKLKYDEAAALTVDGETQKEKNYRLQGLRRSHQSKLYELKLAYQKEISDIKTEVHDVYLDKVNYLTNLNGDTLNLVEKTEASLEKYVYRFNIKDFFLRNGLYIVMILVFLFCGIISGPMGKGTLLNFKNIFEIANQASPRIFLALGVGGLILLAGTDLSIGRMVGLGTVITCMFLYPGQNVMPLFGKYFDFSGWSSALRIIVALIVTIIFTTFFSSIAGFFSAKFKMHPFISTMGTQLIIFGLLAVVTDSKNTGVIDISLKNAIAGKIGNIFPLLLIYAIIGIVIVSFIWNRTKFGKNMYAVGGNPEAASVSGISVFWVTMGVFILAGILYGFGSFFEAARVGTAKFDTGTGYETDAIAACVVGGISFTGGIGKIRGAVIGAIIFTGLTYALSFLGINPYYQYIIKGVIIITAVSLDCLKYLKKK